MIDLTPLKRFLRDQLSVQDADASDDQQLFPAMIDARGVIELADFVEETYAIRFTEEELRAHGEHFRSLRALAALIERKRAAQPG